jgi:hypothetical protein
MGRQVLTRDQFDVRRRKEKVAFLVVKFLRLHVSFKDILSEFTTVSTTGAAAGSGLFEKVHTLAEGLAFDLKEMAHSLFRVEARAINGALPRTGSHDTLKHLASVRTSIEKRSIDSYVGTGYHLLLILQESLYQMEHYSPELDRGKREIALIKESTKARGGSFSVEEQAELDRLGVVDEITEKLATDSAELARGVMMRCESLLEGTAQVIRRFVLSANDNEILLLNLLRSIDLLEKVYGPGASERIFSELCAGKRFTGATGVKRAESYVRDHCGNVSGLSAGSAS